MPNFTVHRRNWSGILLVSERSVPCQIAVDQPTKASHLVGFGSDR